MTGKETEAQRGLSFPGPPDHLLSPVATILLWVLFEPWVFFEAVHLQDDRDFINQRASEHKVARLMKLRPQRGASELQV